MCCVQCSLVRIFTIELLCLTALRIFYLCMYFAAFGVINEDDYTSVFPVLQKIAFHISADCSIFVDFLKET